MTQSADLPAGIPGWRRAPCLGCGERVTERRGAYVLIGGRRDGSLLIVMEAEPQRIFVTAPYSADIPDVYLLGAAHRRCGDRARSNLEMRTVALPEELPLLTSDEAHVIMERLDLPPRPDRCAFCGETDMTTEHVFPKWVSKQIVRKYGRFKYSTPYGVKHRNRIEQTARICQTCNNEWLSALEKDVSPALGPMIVGPKPGEQPCRLLDSDQQRLIAAWAVKTAYMLDLSGQQPIIPAHYYRQLRQYRDALPSTVVLLAAYNGMDSAIFATHGGIRLDGDRSGSHDAFMTTFSVCHVVFKVVGYINTSGPGAQFSYNSKYDAGLQLVWPARQDSVEWPRNGVAFNDNALMELAYEHPDGSDLQQWFPG